MRDLDVRQATRKKLHGEHHDSPDTLIVEEMGIWSGTVRIDIAVINGELSGFELKSDKDTLHRLQYQADVYGKVFDRLSIVVGKRHLEKADAMLPDWWGIISASATPEEVTLDEIRAPGLNPARDPYHVAQLLWKSEAITLLEQFGLARGLRSKPIGLLHERLAAEVPMEILGERVRVALKRRCSWLGQSISDQ
ncbi:hypothetical protein LMIY3S_02728 [Labrys miyagiensis]